MLTAKRKLNLFNMFLYLFLVSLHLLHKHDPSRKILILHVKYNTNVTGYHMILYNTYISGSVNKELYMYFIFLLCDDSRISIENIHIILGVFVTWE